MNIPPELTAMIEAGRAEIAAAERRNQEAQLEWQREQDERNRARLASFLPEWMHDYATVNDDEDGTVSIILPGCAPFMVMQRGDDISGRAWLREPMGVEYASWTNQWYVNTEPHLVLDWSLDALVALAAKWGESYWTMRAEAERRTAAGIKEPAPVEPQAEPVTPAAPGPLERIAVALERIAERLENGVIYTSDADAL